ncbi:Procollagen-lysine,2-oxoglutarate 5-dioxygenase 1 [Seminavis robusta]|uniref:Procollagen-lysine,2-oxoglutarate 5-dioxygenase 1 n=1 Tax=Seminavis robusta TaxID=568900 RepID=A0A9N8DKF1_9STRA|nr:Procollagen-lysine,2-oxoglutarate 5-dioxygenase 1 [Seminavis robusta]|eukprot:Sro170_g075390.1 Procollagen-lysine,2-oxoglutarate 5-dioxygenase 1 (381) ;mRNA; f:41914-43056
MKGFHHGALIVLAVLICQLGDPGVALSRTATGRLPLTLPLSGLSSPLVLDPILGANREFRAPADADINVINQNDIDSVVLATTTSANENKRTKYNANAKVHICRTASALHHSWCREAIDAAESASNNWSTGRHHLYPTTDQPAADLPNGVGEATLDFATNVILPAIAMAFDTPLERLYFKDMFLAKYEPTGQPGLGRHTDGSAFSFNMLLSDPSTDFDGGGTWIEPVGLVQPNGGEVLMHRGSVLHEGCPVTKGSRYVLVGFVQSDDDDDDDDDGYRKSALASQLLQITIPSFPLGMIFEVDEGDKIKCAMVAHVEKGGTASEAGIKKRDCLRGILLSHAESDQHLLTFDGKTLDQVMEMILDVASKDLGPVQMIVERWC